MLKPSLLNFGSLCADLCMIIKASISQTPQIFYLAVWLKGIFVPPKQLVKDSKCRLNAVNLILAWRQPGFKPFVLRLRKLKAIDRLCRVFCFALYEKSSIYEIWKKLLEDRTQKAATTKIAIMLVPQCASSNSKVQQLWGGTRCPFVCKLSNTNAAWVPDWKQH